LRVLFLAEAVTWSQVVRLAVLAKGLRGCDVHFASSRFDERLFQGLRCKRWPIYSLAAEQVDRAVARGGRIYSRATLERYVRDELRLFEAIKPDVVVSDLRWSTTVSAPVFGVPCCSLINAYWSRRAARDRFPVPDHPIVRLLGEQMAEKYFPIALPAVLRHFVAPINALRRAHHLSQFADLLEMITWGDRVLFPDDPGLTPLTSVAPNETFLGPILWAPRGELPSTSDRMIYATLGSSGSLRATRAMIEGLGMIDAEVLLATAGRFVPRSLPANVRAVEMVPGDLAARRAAVVVCNGGASTGYQALAEGTPIVGIASNLDQYLAMTAMQRAGVMLRASTLRAEQVHDAVLSAMTMRASAAEIARSFATHDPHARFARVLNEIASPRAAHFVQCV
jgi:UDP:flavonoid glycosyltransferase YjiC (YdhE family)